MTLEEFKHAIEKNEEPQNLHHLLKALWSDAQGKWDDAHDFSQTDDSENGAWVHAYLHRKEGDIGNASYWYRRAGQKVSSASLEDEWCEIATELLNHLT